jgi:demethoxyubiquinone hydroxylase (CLK1/Coq7/Cat5 family)
LSPVEVLVRQLQNAHAGELAAAHAYHGHWRSLSPGEERERVRAIEAEEWHHRELVGEMLRRLGAAPRPSRERAFAAIGRTLGPLCHVSGWLLPMYGAGFLERFNVAEYERAARSATEAGHSELVDCLLAMAEVEWDHESYFRSRVAGRFRRVPLWPPLPPRASIRIGAGRPPLPEDVVVAPVLPAL